MYQYKQYKGKILKKLPNIGNKILKLNTNMSSFMLDEYIYQNDLNEFFYVTGAYQHPSLVLQKCTIDQHYHIAIAIPLKSEDLLRQYLKGKIFLGNILNESKNSFIIKLKAPIYNRFKDGPIQEEEVTMCPVENMVELTRKVELEVSEFEFIEAKSCLTKNLPNMYNPKHTFSTSLYEHRKKLGFIFIDEDEKREIDLFIRS